MNVTITLLGKPNVNEIICAETIASIYWVKLFSTCVRLIQNV